MSKLNNGDMPSMPTYELNGQNVLEDTSYGLTKREQFAAMAMQGLLANSGFTDSLFQNRDELDGVFDSVLRAAVMSADALLKELEK